MEPHIEFMRSPSSPNLKPGYADKEVLRLARSLGPPASKHQGRVALLVAGVHVGVLRPGRADQTKLISLGLTDLLQRKRTWHSTRREKDSYNTAKNMRKAPNVAGSSQMSDIIHQYDGFV